jgi:hypothetical protein
VTRRTIPATLVATLALSLCLAACGGGSQKAAPTTLPPTTPALPTTTTAPPTAPLTGVLATDLSRLARPALVVKIDNAPQALPQAGLGQADVVFEEQVEGGITRFAAVFQSQDADPIGPIRSVRSTDVAIVSMLNHPLYAYSGGNTVFQAQIRAAPILDVGDDAQPGLYLRTNDRASPHNMFTRTSGLFALAPKGSGPPSPLFSYRAAGTPSSAAGAQPDTHLAVPFPGSGGPLVTWDWDGGSHSWKRGQGGGVDNDAAGHQISAANVIVQYVPYHNTGLIDPARNPVPEAGLVGQGDVAIFTGGAIVRGHWSKPTPDAVTSYTDPAGQPIQLAPGPTWIELPPLGTITQTS